ncbi:hypothetical protein LOD99_9177 [Oopsacas minuta]|uniref:Uncharacterized protein n=1 Tax=Oopsacas minuta TaxID=111878 RepID=A0AAV7JDJ7_9METZ|nr:hypothetical protein LOD99_9177 [Oopsacas minuta]
MRRAVLVAGSFAISFSIPFSLNVLGLLHNPSLARDKMGFGLSVMCLSFYNLSSHRLASGNVSPDALLLSGIMGIYGARMALHHGYKLWTQDQIEISCNSFDYPNTILTGSGNEILHSIFCPTAEYIYARKSISFAL